MLNFACPVKSVIYIVSVHGTLKLENRNWKFGLHAFVLLMNAFNFGPSFSTIALYSIAFDSDKPFLLTLSPGM